MKKSSNKFDSIFSGIFWVLSGLVLLSINFLDLGSVIRTSIQSWSLLILAIYLIVFSLSRYMGKIYFIFGVLLFALWLGRIINEYVAGYKIIFLVTMVVLSLGVIVYGFFFNQTENKVKYVVAGGAFLMFSVLVFLSIINKFSFSSLLQKASPIFIVLLGIASIQKGWYMYKKNDEEKEEMDEDEVEKRNDTVSLENENIPVKKSKGENKKNIQRKIKGKGKSEKTKDDNKKKTTSTNVKKVRNSSNI